MTTAAFTTVFFLLAAGNLYAQDFKSDLLLIDSSPVQDAHRFDHYHGTYNGGQIMQTKSKDAVALYNPVTLVLKGSMFFYQHVLSPQLSRSCPYEITCSNFSKLAIKNFGVLKGIMIGADRIMRCNRISLEDVRYLNINETTGKIIDFPLTYK